MVTVILFQDVKEALETLRGSVDSAELEHTQVMSVSTAEQAAEIQELVQNTRDEWRTVTALNEDIRK